jgi:hypothetical protein
MCNCGDSHDNHEGCCSEGYGGGTCQCGEGCGGECQCGGGCNCDNRHFQRRFKTKAEQIVELESYLSELKKEVQAVEEMLADLRK